MSGFFAYSLSCERVWEIKIARGKPTNLRFVSQVSDNFNRNIAWFFLENPQTRTKAIVKNHRKTVKNLRFYSILWLPLSFLLSCGGLPTIERSILETVNTLRFVQTQTTDYSIGFTVSGILGKGLEVANGSESILVEKDGTYTFKTKQLTQSTYNVSIKTKPKEPEQNCEVAGGQGTIVRGNVDTIRINCGSAINSKVKITGTISGLQGSGLQISNTSSAGNETINVNSTSFAFTSIPSGSTYSFAVATQPSNPSQTCTITAPTNLSGTASFSDLSLTVNCTTNSYSVSAQVTGIVGTLPVGQPLQLMLNGSETVDVRSDGTFPFPTALTSGSTYTLVIVNSSGLIATGKCNIPTNTGTIGGTAATVLVNCTDGFAVQGTVTIGGGTPSTVIGTDFEIMLSHNGGGPAFTSQTIAISPGATTFSFPNAIPGGSEYIININGNPDGQVCTITAGAGPTFISSNVNNVVLDCGLPSPSIVTPIPGTYGDDIASVTFSTPISGAEIRWSLGNGSQADPTCAGGSTGSPAITSNSTGTIKFRQCRTGWTASPVIVETYTLKANTPTFSITPGSFVNTGASLSYSSTTTSNWFCASFVAATPTDPSCGSAASTCNAGVLNSGFTFTSGSFLNFKVRTCKVGFQESDIASATYTFNQYSIGGTVTGLTTPFGANTLVLRNNAGNDLTIAANGTFTFSNTLSTGASYNVTVFSNPQNPWQTCTISNGSGTVGSSNVTNIGLSCTLNTYTMAGTVTSSIALPSGLSLTNGVDTVNITPGSTSTPVSFSTVLNSGSTYNVSITAEPSGYVCAVSSPLTGSIAGANITDVGVNCVAGHRTGNSIFNRFPSPINVGTYRGNVNPVAGSSNPGYTDATGTSARFGTITGITIDTIWGYAVDNTNHTIRRINPSNNAVTSFVGNGSPGNVVSGIPSGAALNGPYGISTDGTFLYVSESLGNRIKRIRISDTNIETLAGDDSVLSPANALVDGTGTAARFSSPRGIILDGENLYIADSGNNAIRVLNIRTKVVTTLTSNPVFLDAPDGIALVGNTLYTTNPGNSRDCITATLKTTGANSTFAGNGGLAGFRDGTGVNNTRFNDPSGIAHDDENLYVTDTGNNRIRKINIRSGEVTTIAGNGGNALISGVGPYAYTTSPRAISRGGEAFVFAVDHAIRTLSDQSLIAHYRLKGNTDTSVGNVNLAPAGTPVFGLGRFGETNGALVNSTVSINAVNRSLNGLNTVSMAGWFFWDGTGGGTQRVIFYNGNSGSDGSGLELNAVNSLQIIRGGIGVSPANFVLPSNVWVHLALVILPDNTHRVFVNGKNVFETNVVGNAVSNRFQLGSNGAGSNIFPGRIAEVRLYNRVLGEGEAIALAKDADSSLVGASYASHPSELLMNYKFDNNLFAQAPVGETLANFGSWTYSRGKEGLVNTSIRLDGASRMESSSLGLPQGDHPRTVCAWVYPENFPALGTLQTVFRYGDTTGTTSFSLRVMNFSGVHYIVFGGVGAGSDLVFQYKLNLNRWTHLCSSVDSASTARVYANGALIGSGTITPLNTSGSSIILIGAFNTAVDLWAGKIADFRIYSKALSQVEVRRIGAQIPQGLVAYFDVNGDELDSSGFGANGSVNGSISYQTDRNGITNGSLRAPGGTNFVQASDAFLPSGKNPRTLCMWYKSESVSTSIPFGYGNPGAASGLTYFWIENDNYIRLWGQGSDLNSSIPVRNHIWRHVCGTNDGAGTPSGNLYVNGRIVASGTHNITLVSDGLLKFGSPLGGSGRAYTGLVDDLMVFNRVLSGSEIIALSGAHPMQTGVWSPTIGSSNLKLHLTAESLSNLSSGNNVTSWEDQSGNGGDFVNGGAPLFQANGIPFNTHRGSNTIEFNGTSHELFRASAIPGIASDFFTFYTIIKRNNATANEGFFETNPGANGLLIQFDGGLLRASKVNVIGLVESLTSAFNENSRPYMIETRYEYNILTNIASQGTGVQSGGTNILQSFGTSSLYRIGRSSWNSTYFNGDISEILYFNESLNLVDRTIVHCYLSQRYNLPLNPGFLCD